MPGAPAQPGQPAQGEPRSSRWRPRRKDRGVPIRIGVNAGSLHPDIYKRFGGATPEALVESARLELAYFEEVGLQRRQDLGQGVVGGAHDRRLPAGRRDLRPPAAPRRDRGRPAAGRPGQGHGRHRDAARRGHRRHHPLLAHRRSGRGGPRRAPAPRVARPARAQGGRPHRLPVVRARAGRRDRGGQGGPGGARGAQPADPGGRHGLRRERARARRARRISASRRASRRATCSSRARSCASCPRTRWSRRWCKRPSAWWPRASRPGWPRRTRAPRPRRRPTAPQLLAEGGADPNATRVKVERMRARHGADGEAPPAG